MTAVAAVVLAAGTASRYRAAGGAMPTKLVAHLNGVPLVRWVAEAAVASRAHPVVVVTGHAEDHVRLALEGLAVAFTPNPDYATGLASSLRVGLAAIPPEAHGALVLLGDMPRVTAGLVDTLIEAFGHSTGVDAVVPTYEGRRGNPALLGRSLFAAAATLAGDEGARRLLFDASVREVPVEDEAVTLDVDEPETLGRIA